MADSNIIGQRLADSLNVLDGVRRDGLACRKKITNKAGTVPSWLLLNT